MRTILTILTLLALTPVLGSVVIVAAFLRVPDRPGSVYDRMPRLWTRAILRAANVGVVVHHPERMRTGAPRIFVSNHVSWFDVVALASVLPRYKFVAKSELFRIPIFGQGARAAGTIEIERDNRKAAFGSYRVAAERIRAGSNVIVFPEGTRGTTYPLRPFKKGPFVLAIAAGVPIVPTVVYGAIEVLPRGSFRVRPRTTIEIHLLPEVETSGLAYDDREALMQTTWDRMANALREEHGVESVRPPSRAVQLEA